MYLGFLLAVYAVIGNDVIQTLGTFLTSNEKTHWSILWSFAAITLSATLIYGWYYYGGDVTYGRLNSIPLPDKIHWWYLIAPAALLVITRFGFPVSTTFMILSIFSSQMIIQKIIEKSIYGYAIAIVTSFLFYILIAKQFESKESLEKLKESNRSKYWKMAQWASTAFLWSQWLIQDFANIYVFLPRKLSFVELLLTLALILTVMAFIIRKKGGKIQKIVTQKVNSHNIRSATIIDFSYGVILFAYGNFNAIPMSTTWVFIGVLAGREIAINFLLNKDRMKHSYKLVVKDFSKASMGLVISILIIYFIQFISKNI